MSETFQPMPEQKQDSEAPPSPLVPRNFTLGVVNGALIRAGMKFMSPYFVLAAFIYELTGSNFLVGLLGALATAGMMWPQLYVSSLLEHRPHKKPFYIFSSALRAVLLIVLAATMWACVSTGGRWPLVLFFVVYFLFRSAQGIGMMPFLDLVARTLPPARLGVFFAYRTFFGETLGLLAGFLAVQPILGEDPTPAGYILLIVIGALIMSCAWTVFSFAGEPGDPNPPKRRTFLRTIRAAGKAISRDRNYRTLLYIRILLRFNVLGLMFFVPYGTEHLGAAHIGGIFAGVLAVSRLLSSMVWGNVSRHKGNRSCLIWGSTFFAASPLLALAAPHFPRAFALDLPFTTVALTLPLAAYLAALCLFGLAMEANMIGTHAFMLEAAPPNRRPSYVAFLNTVTFPMTLMPVVAGAIIGDHANRLSALFVLTATTGILTFLATVRLREVRKFGVDEPEN